MSRTHCLQRWRETPLERKTRTWLIRLDTSHPRRRGSTERSPAAAADRPSVHRPARSYASPSGDDYRTTPGRPRARGTATRRWARCRRLRVSTDGRSAPPARPWSSSLCLYASSASARFRSIRRNPLKFTCSFGYCNHPNHRAAQGPKFKIPLLRSFVPRPIEQLCQVSSTSAERSPSLGVLQQGCRSGFKKTHSKWHRWVGLTVSLVLKHITASDVDFYKYWK